MRNPFLVNVSCISDENDRLQSELIDLKCDLSAKQMFENSSMVQYWINIQSSYLYLYKEAIKAILPFPTTYLCKSGFSTMVHLKSKKQKSFEYETRHALLFKQH